MANVVTDVAGETTVDMANTAIVGVQSSPAYPGVCNILLGSGAQMTLNQDISVVLPAFRATRA